MQDSYSMHDSGVMPTASDATATASSMDKKGEFNKYMTGYGHTELFKVTCYNFQPSRAC